MAALNLEDYIKQLQDPVPEFRDPEDLGDETSARLAPRATDEEETSLPAGPSALRRRAATHFWDSGGKKTTRRELYGDSGEESVSEVNSDNDDDESLEPEVGEEKSDDDDDMDDRMEEDESFDALEESEDENVENSDDNDDGSSDDDGEDDKQEEDVAEDDEAEDEEITSEESGAEDVVQGTALDEGEKAEAVVQQLDLWDRLMEARIQLQKVVSMVNRLPPSPDHSTAPLLPQAKEVLLAMNHTLHDVHDSPSSPRKRKADADADELACDSYESLAKQRNTTLTFWDEKTRLASKKFKSFKSYQTPVVKQVEQILSDRDRLLRRTQVLRDTDGPELCDNKPDEIYDDGDFYQRLLKNLIERKTDDTSLSSSSQWLEVQRLRGRKKKKRDIDTRASKGRKLRYNVHSKLVNILAPRDDSTWSNDAKNELFKNLFRMPGQHES